MTGDVLRELEKLQLRGRRGGRRRRGEIRDWMEAHPRKVAEVLEAGTWDDLREAMLRAGLRLRDGSEPTVAALKAVWVRIGTARAAADKAPT